MFTLGDISFYEIPNFLLITIVGMLVISILFGLLMGRFIFAPVVTFLLLAISAFILPNFYDIKYQPLLGYAGFLSVIALILSIIFWYMTRDRRKAKRMKQKELDEQKRYDNIQNQSEMESVKRHEK
ncbi:hypothetical protein [Macrococcus armenti]|uniref:hypothetical protein n=1 Tax=Macrococcus armenti TaxID=2875764 RepID=UPI001CCE6FA6|nr:hypothetical protein [Macrococcus armenti]UBH07550.1 hypothetical protein LAU41_05765 [Macrococcus armenti]UBH11948.1 hypothetical protein LAU38_05665 [Macrococcus armenti]UBH14326.1 hypothetical protein LAU44_05910 [Macrococcus armenti]UBH16686.1 hypothetical protein LAU39_05925 [Macrococcus armenti]UBH18949.1 hypothetical protein LAU40_05915 [Macrococcus armenti]